MAEPLSLPENATAALHHAHNSTSSDDSKFSVYTLLSSDLSTQDIKAACEEMTMEYVEEILGDSIIEDYHQFLNPEDRGGPFSTSQKCLNHHFKALDEILLHGDSDGDIELYPYGIVILDTKDWRKDGVLLIHCDEIRKSWHIGSTRLSMSETGLNLTSLRFGDLGFGDLCKSLGVRVPQNDPEIDPHYEETEKDEDDMWRGNQPCFAVFSTGLKGTLSVIDMLENGHYDVPHDHTSLHFFAPGKTEFLGSWDEVKRHFPVLVRDDVLQEELRHLGEGPCKKCRPLHPRLFICVDNADPRNDGVLVCRMDWDGNVEGRDDHELMAVGRRANLETKRTGVAFALSTIQVMVAEEA